jgi:hypothetical protein
VGKERPAHNADNLTAIYEPIIWKMWEPRRLTTLWASAVSYRDSFIFLPYVGIFFGIHPSSTSGTRYFHCNLDFRIVLCGLKIFSSSLILAFLI